MPSSEYLVHSVAQSGGVASPTGLTIRTSRWCDVVDEFCEPSNCPTTQPDFVDISAVVDKFKGVPTAPIRARAQLQPRVPDLTSSVVFSTFRRAWTRSRGSRFRTSGGLARVRRARHAPPLTNAGGVRRSRRGKRGNTKTLKSRNAEMN